MTHSQQNHRTRKQPQKASRVTGMSLTELQRLVPKQASRLELRLTKRGIELVPRMAAARSGPGDLRKCHSPHSTFRTPLDA